MPLTTHVFKVGDGNFVVSHSNGVMVINDAGYGGGHPTHVQDDVVREFRNILGANDIHTVHTVISHQDKDHYDLLEPLFGQIEEEQKTRGQNNPLTIGRIVIGGDRFINQNASNMHTALGNIAKQVGPITAEFVGHGDQYTTVTTHTYNRQGRFSSDEDGDKFVLSPGIGKSTINEFRRIYFEDPNASGSRSNRSKYLKLFYPSNMDKINPTRGSFFGGDYQGPLREPNNSNDTNLVGMLVTKKGEKGNRTKRKGLLWGDASTKLQEMLEINRKDVAWTIPPHHLSATDDQAVIATDTAAGGKDWSGIKIVGSTARGILSDKFKARGTLPDEFAGSKRKPNMLFTSDIADNQFITVFTKSGKHPEAEMKAQNFRRPVWRQNFDPMNQTSGLTHPSSPPPGKKLSLRGSGPKEYTTLRNFRHWGSHL